MHEGRVRSARRGPAPLLLKLSLVGAGIAACASGCASEVNTLEPGDDAAAGANGTDTPVMSASGKSSTSGGSTSATGGSGGSGGKVVNAFGGTVSAGGTAAGGTAAGGAGGASGNAGMAGAAGASGKASGGGGGAAQAGAASGGNKNGGAAGQAGTGGTGQSGGASGGMAGSAGGGSLACLAAWKNDQCDTCSKQTQSDKLGCVDILDCYFANSCGPASCAGNTDKCGANNIGKGTAGYPIAQDVYACLCK